MTEQAPAPTRSNLHALQRRLDRVARGAALLRRKREVLAAELFRIARPALDARAEIALHARHAWEQLAVALAVRGSGELEALGLPIRTVSLQIGTRVVWGVEVPDLGERPRVVRSLAVRDVAPGTPGPAADEAASAFEQLVEELLDAAPRELLLERLGEHLARTSQQIHVLEQRLGPRLTAQHAAIRRVLEEREREDHVRMRHLLRRRHR